MNGRAFWAVPVVIALVLIASGAAAMLLLWPDQPSPFGYFVGRVEAVWNEDGRTMRLLQPLSYVDPAGRTWTAPAGSVIDGASIPRPFWSLIGGPFEGRYRNASVIHDAACQKRDRPWEDVHLMFYHACRAGGVSEQKAKLMYLAVYHFGPRWPSDGGLPGRSPVFQIVQPDEESVRTWAKYVEDQNPSLEQIRELKLLDPLDSLRP